MDGVLPLPLLLDNLRRRSPLRLNPRRNPTPLRRYCDTRRIPRSPPLRHRRLHLWLLPPLALDPRSSTHDRQPLQDVPTRSLDSTSAVGTDTEELLDGWIGDVRRVHLWDVLGRVGTRCHGRHCLPRSSLGRQLLGKSLLAPTSFPPNPTAQVPFALVMESIRDLETTHLPSLPPTPIEPLTPTKLHLSQPFRASLRQGSLPRIRPVERTPLLSTPSSPSSPTSPSPVSTTPERKIAGGTILGIHNLAIVAPQFFVAIIAALIFKSIQLSRDGQGPIPGGDDEDGLRGSNDVVWVLRFGGLAAVGGAVMSRWVLRTRSESSYVRFLQSSVEPDEEQVDKRPTTP